MRVEELKSFKSLYEKCRNKGNNLEVILCTAISLTAPNRISVYCDFFVNDCGNIRTSPFRPSQIGVGIQEVSGVEGNCKFGAENGII